MRRALVIGDTGGIGAALSKALAERDVEVTGRSRSGDGLDLTDEASVETVLGSLEGPFDLILVATGALEINGHEPEKTLRDLVPAAMMAQFQLNTIGPALVLKHSVRLMPRQGRSVFAALSARVGSIGDNRMGGWYSYRTAKAALNQMLHGASVEVARTHSDAIVIALHPGTVATAFTEKYLGRHPAVEPNEAAANLLSVIDDLAPEDTGGFRDYAGKVVPW